MDKFIFLVDFVILHLDDMVEVPLILGRPFLATSQALIDVKDGRMVLRVEEEEIVFKIKDSMRHFMDFNDTCYFVDVVNDLITNYVQDTWMKDELSELLKDEAPNNNETSELVEEVYHQYFFAAELLLT